MVNRLLPDDQRVASISPSLKARDAILLMRTHGFSQLPVVEGDAVLGLFTYRAFALEAAKHSGTGVELADLPVEEFLEHEDVAYARLTDEFRNLLRVLNTNEAILVSGPDDLIAILTPMDVLNYLYRVASPFVLIEEIELALRALISAATAGDGVFQTCVKTTLARSYTDRRLPTRPEEMAFDDYVGLLRDGRNWAVFEPVFGGTRERLRGKLEPVRDLRNSVFHFRRELSVEDHTLLVACRDWLFRCIRKLEQQERGS